MINLTKRGKIYHANTTVGGVRLRGSLGTKDPKVAARLARRLETAITDGPKSEVWGELRSSIPLETYNMFSCGRVAEPLRVGSIWSNYNIRLHRKVASKELAVSTVERYLKVASDWKNWCLLDKSIQLMDEITPTVIEEYRAVRLAQTLTRKQSRGGQGLDVDVVVLKQIFDLAIELGYSKPNPVKSINRTKVRAVRGAEPFTPMEVERLLHTAHYYDTLSMTAVYLLKWTGLRGSDIVSLQWSDFDWVLGILKIPTLKRGKEVIIPLHRDLISKLQYHLQIWGCVHPLVLEGMTRPQLYNLVKKLGEKAGVPNAHPHRFRDTMAVTMLENGATIYDVAKILGDTVATVEKHYAPFTDKLQERVREILEKEN